MTLAKVVTLQARPGYLTVLEEALTDAHHAAAAEVGTTAWEWFPGATPDSRVIVELFADDEAAAEHDASPAVAVLLARFADVLLTDPEVQVYSRPKHGAAIERETT